MITDVSQGHLASDSIKKITKEKRAQVLPDQHKGLEVKLQYCQKKNY
jgi:hypothetical protein